MCKNTGHTRGVNRNGVNYRIGTEIYTGDMA